MKKIPDNAIRVFEGVIFDVYQWQQEMFDRSFATFEALRRKDSVTVIAIVDSAIIITNEEQPGQPLFRGLPGGESERGESHEETAKRELLEETGYSSDAWSLWFVTDVLNYGKLEWNNAFYIARNCKKVSEPHLDPGERIQVTFATFDEFLELRHNPKSRNKDLFPLLEKAANSEEEWQALQTLLGIPTAP